MLLTLYPLQLVPIIEADAVLHMLGSRMTQANMHAALR